MRALQASTSYSAGLGISSVAAPPSRPRRRLGAVAKVEPTEKSIEIMRKFSEQYARKSDTYFCVDKGVTSVVIKGLAEHRDTLGAPLCPCRHYDDKAAEAQQGFWNCPCVPMRERSRYQIKIHHDVFFFHSRGLNLKLCKSFKSKAITMEEIRETTANM
ncbi:ferredoxin-thioredoxin reductase catalytic chain, chloroplastic-like isoform X2 [Salvia splendens]|uniref:ferredoxin-thioredoxin reductase catalytic chain, chloroplastic-like isoform X2 n=1 Tax=Salvia splendens TaxID=180675 RepID=UPI001C272205|nr:ferredoxin-thioredoxin reductase catalytic chain, chloroplastic-like isoform X2 [Salvia splendens]